MELLQTLNDAQRQAVTATEGFIPDFDLTGV